MKLEIKSGKMTDRKCFVSEIIVVLGKSYPFLLVIFAPLGLRKILTKFRLNVGFEPYPF